MKSASPRTALLRWLAPSSDPAARRVVVAGVAGVLLTAPLSAQQFIRPAPLLGYSLTAVGAVLAVCCCRWAWKPSAAITWLATFACVGFAAATVTQGAGQVAGALRATEAQLVCRDDVAPAVVVGGQLVLRGSNPYTSYNVLRAEQSLGCPSFHVTPLRAGAFAGRATEPSAGELQGLARASIDADVSSSILLSFSYPAGSALAGIAGAHGVVMLNVLLLLAAGVLVVRMSPLRMRRWVTLALAAQTGALIFIGPAHPDGIVAALLIVACARREPLVSGASLGLACAIKQTAWFIAPALLLLAFRRGRRAGLRQASATALAFAAVNLPFAAANPSAWLRSVLAERSAAAFPFGDGGPVGLFTSGGHLTLVVGIFTAVMVVTVLGGWLLAWRGRGGWAQAGVIVSSLALWDGARSLLIYLGLLGLIAVSICARDLVPRAASAREPGHAWRLRAQPVR